MGLTTRPDCSDDDMADSVEKQERQYYIAGDTHGYVQHELATMAHLHSNRMLTSDLLKGAVLEAHPSWG